ncbi:haloacid dehalogenase superfamily, subfamily IA, variant 3 with third motif having DD or ED [Roseivivax sediminis]|uniref:Haloacid dehalogenase superfamily, subfamily IA, variant 3 with third motif having DD or ED n=1 Tax=Roseivivax sediminis TaxID=936889 RepID=A0A1I2DCY6_9RHOB|nr:haloacid dehalogenase superfamily, subfamily IA, variant 3 with third motif having DD or ED [Roseivivax sediminis]
MLVDSEPIAVDVLRETLRCVGLEISPTTAYERFLGRSLASILRDVAERDGLVLTEADLADMRARLARRFENELRPVPGVAAAVGALDAAVCVASSSHPERLALSLRVTGLAPLFGADVFSAVEVERGKPAPDLFLHAARRMHAPARGTVVIEDSPAGIAAARAAGMRVVGFTGGAHAGPAMLDQSLRAMGPDAVVTHMDDLAAALDALPA